MQFPPLFADIGGLIGLIIWVVIMIISAVSKAGGKKAAAAKKKPPMGQGGMGQGGLGQGGMGQGGVGQPRAQQGGKQAIEMEIEDFLRQARGGNAPPAAPPRNPPVRNPQPAGPIVEARPADEDIVPGKGFGRGVSSHVQEHIGRDSISTHDAHLADDIEAADERIEQHLEEVFDHDVGQLENIVDVDTSIAEGTDAKTLDEAEADRLEAANRIREMLSKPGSIREVFVASEILKRPEF